MRTEWQGLWYQNEGSNLYKSVTFTKKHLEEILKETKGNKVRFLLKHNKYYNELKNRPRYHFCLADSIGYQNILEIKESEVVKRTVIDTNEAIEVARNLLHDYENGYSIDDLVVEAESFIKQKSETLNTLEGDDNQI